MCCANEELVPHLLVHCRWLISCVDSDVGFVCNGLGSGRNGGRCSLELEGWDGREMVEKYLGLGVSLLNVVALVGVESAYFQRG